MPCKICPAHDQVMPIQVVITPTDKKRPTLKGAFCNVRCTMAWLAGIDDEFEAMLDARAKAAQPAAQSEDVLFNDDGPELDTSFVAPTSGEEA